MNSPGTFDAVDVLLSGLASVALGDILTRRRPVSLLSIGLAPALGVLLRDEDAEAVRPIGRSSSQKPPPFLDRHSTVVSRGQTRKANWLMIPERSALPIHVEDNRSVA